MSWKYVQHLIIEKTRNFMCNFSVIKVTIACIYSTLLLQVGRTQTRFLGEVLLV